ncbi:MAG: DnaT-like ssDNA-binding domain-containing protein [Pseudomonadota bacterium]|nr:DnaT-like ssDNA-binding domain-containing protein [Pseudomonadota bacterium]
MPIHPLIGDHTISLSSTLAATIGLNEALLLTVLNDAARLQTQPQARLAADTLRRQLPFFDDATLKATISSLISQGLLVLHGPEFGLSAGIIFSFGDAPNARQAERGPAVPARYTATQPQASKTPLQGNAHASPGQAARQTPVQMSAQSSAQSPAHAPSHSGRGNQAQPIPEQWSPAEETLQRLEQHGIPRAFSCAQLDAFVLQGREQGSNRNDWNTRFFRHVKNQWVYTQNDASRFRRQEERTAFSPAPKEEARPISADWSPSDDARQILQRAGIDPQFISDAVPEFVLYWAERGDAIKTWNSKFIQHVRQQWARYTAAVEHSTVPTRIDSQWTPADDCFDILAMGHIPEDFARALVGEFVLYWRDSNQVHNSWNSRFLQYVKQQWAKRLAQSGSGEGHGQQATAQPGYATAEASVHRLNDTSWAK